VPLDRHFDLSHTSIGIRDMLLPPDQFAASYRSSGSATTPSSWPIRKPTSSGAARLWWALRYFGNTLAAMLDGGIDEWQAEGRTACRCLLYQRGTNPYRAVDVEAHPHEEEQQ
jgi:3-mercaptopyruvate sulfurtransferase SseA